MAFPGNAAFLRKTRNKKEKIVPSEIPVPNSTLSKEFPDLLEDLKVSV